MAAGSSTNESRSETRRQAAINEKNKKAAVEEFNCKCQRTFTTSSGYKRHQRFCPENETSASARKAQNNAESKAEEAPSEKNFEEEADDSSQRESNDDGMSEDSNDGTVNEDMLESMGDLMDQALGPGKCHCCGEDLDTAHEGGDFECADCQKRFKLKSSLERHRRVIHMEGQTFQCPECDARCPDKGTLARHMYTHTGLKPYSCLRCRKTFSRKYHLERHVLQTGCDGSPKPNHPCQVCGRVFSRKDNLREHLRAHAGQVKRKKKLQCPQCEKEYQGQAMLHAHILREHTKEENTDNQTRDRPYQCEFCSRCFPSSGAMKKHRRMHTGERPYECKECFAKFAAKETLNRHVKTHTGVKPHICQFCGKSFIQASQLRAHVFHHTGENGFTCDHCNKAFNRRARLLMHVKYVHEGAKPHQCEQCKKTFVRKEDLARHNILHSGVKAHKCPICQKAFAMKSSLKIHLLTHTKEPPRSCDECGRAFIRQDCLLRHMRTKHRDMLEEILAEAEKKKLQTQLLAAAASDAAAAPLSVPSGGTAPLTMTGGALGDDALAAAVRELLTLLVDEATLKVFGWPDAAVDQLLEAVIRRCGHTPVGADGQMAYTDRLRENAKLLFTVVIDDSAVKTLLNNQTVDEVILHVLRLAKS